MSGPSPEGARERARLGKPDQVSHLADAQLPIVEVRLCEARAYLLSEVLEPYPFLPQPPLQRPRSHPQSGSDAVDRREPDVRAAQELRPSLLRHLTAPVRGLPIDQQLRMAAKQAVQ